MTLDAVLGLRIEELSGDAAVGTFVVGPPHRQRFGLVHGGTYAAVAEFLASEGTLHGLAATGGMAVGASNHTSFLRPVREGVVRAVGRPRHRGRRSWLWEVDFEDEQGRLCATTRVTMAVVPSPDGPPELILAPTVLGHG